MTLAVTIDGPADLEAAGGGPVIVLDAKAAERGRLNCWNRRLCCS